MLQTVVLQIAQTGRYLGGLDNGSPLLAGELWIVLLQDAKDAVCTAHT